VGNKTGWIIAGVIVLAILGIVVKVWLFPSPSRPTSTTLKKGFMDELVVDASLALVTGAVPAGSGNAGDDYKAAFDAYTRNKALLEEFDKELGRNNGEVRLTSGKLTPPADVLDALKEIAGHVEAGAQKGSFEYLFTHTPKSFEVGYKCAGVVDMLVVYNAVLRLVWYHWGLKEYDKIAELQKNLIVMGAHMAGEGARLHMTESGLSIQYAVANDLAGNYRNAGEAYSDKIAPLEKYGRAVNVALRRVNAINGLFKDTTLPVGDILNIADKHKDRAVRVQAILFLARVRFEVSGRRGDIRYANKLIDRYADSSDPFEAAAAGAADDLTEEGWKKLYEREG